MNSNNKKVVLAFGELMLRHSVSDIKDITELDQADPNLFVDSFGGSEANVLAGLEGLGVRTRFFTAVPYNDEGKRAIEHLQSSGIDTDSVLVGGDKMGTYYVATNCTDRALATKYDRDDASITLIDPAQIDYDKLFENVELFHFSGVNLALKGNTRKVCEALVEEANKRNIKISFDFNYRENLWKKDNTKEGIEKGKEEAKNVFQSIVPNCNIVFGSKRDLEWFDFEGTFEEFLKKYPNIDCLVTRDKKQIDQTNKQATGAIYTATQSYIMKEPRNFTVKENIGGGDAYDAGILYGLLDPSFSLEKVVKFGIETYVLKHQIMGDVLIDVSKEKVEASLAEQEKTAKPVESEPGEWKAKRDFWLFDDKALERLSKF